MWWPFFRALNPARWRTRSLVNDLSEEHETPSDPQRPVRRLEISWEALEDAFENNAPEVHSYLHLATGEVLRVVDGVADPAMHQRIAGDGNYLRVDPVSSREQYRWMERYIATVTEPELRSRLMTAIDGKGAFRRFKDVLMAFPADREKWFEFRTERLRSCMESWLVAHKIEATARPVWSVAPAAEGAVETAGAESIPPPPNTVTTISRPPSKPASEQTRRKLHDIADSLPASQLQTALAFLEFLVQRADDALTSAHDAMRDASQHDGAGSTPHSTGLSHGSDSGPSQEG